jgi:serine/threonine-protein kinase
VLIGTPFYMSPEQARGERELTPQTDIYALGTVLYEMLTGSVLFDGDTYLEILAKHQVDPPPLLAERRPGLDVPEEVEGLIRRMLEKDRKRRPASMAEVANVLQRHAQGGASAGAPSTKASPPQKHGYAETILAYQPPREAPSAQAAPPSGDLATGQTIESGASLEWSAEGGPSPTTVIRKDTRRRKLLVVGTLVGLVVLAGIVAAVVLGSPPARKSSRAESPEPPAPAGGVAPEEDVGDRHVTVEVEVKPASASIFVDGAAQEGNPIRIDVAQGTSMTLRAEASGYTTLEKEIIADSNRSFSWQLEPLQTDRPKGKMIRPPSSGPPAPGAQTGDGSVKGKKKIKVDKDNPYLTGS